MNLDLTQIAVQLPVLSLFVWFVLKNNREWRLYVKERNGKTEGALKEITKSLRELSQELHRRAR